MWELFVPTQHPQLLKVTGHFNSLHYWNLDVAPGHDDGIQQALQWTQIAETVSSVAPSPTALQVKVKNNCLFLLR